MQSYGLLYTETWAPLISGACRAPRSHRKWGATRFSERKSVRSSLRYFVSLPSMASLITAKEDQERTTSSCVGLREKAGSFSSVCAQIPWTSLSQGSLLGRRYSFRHVKSLERKGTNKFPNLQSYDHSMLSRIWVFLFFCCCCFFTSTELSTGTLFHSPQLPAWGWGRGHVQGIR